jgi:hypothetical protein
MKAKYVYYETFVKLMLQQKVKAWINQLFIFKRTKFIIFKHIKIYFIFISTMIILCTHTQHTYTSARSDTYSYN